MPDLQQHPPHRGLLAPCQHLEDTHVMEQMCGLKLAGLRSAKGKGHENTGTGRQVLTPEVEECRDCR